MKATDELIEDGFVSVKDAAKYLGVGRTKLYELMDEGVLPHGKVGRVRRIPWRSLKNYAKSILPADDTNA